MQRIKFTCAMMVLLIIPALSWGANTVTRNGDLRFGPFVSLNSTGKVTVTPAGARSAQGGATLLSRGIVSAAQYVMTGKKNDRYTITLPADNTVHLSAGGKYLPLSGFTCSIPLSGRLPMSGQLTFTVGATLTAAPATTPGTYSGEFTVTVE
jgi:hypothetical protein